MKKIILMGRVGCGKTTLTQALRGKTIHYHKTQYINHHDVVIDTPGEYAETQSLGRALALYSYEADVVGLLVSATEDYCLFPPNVTPCANRPSSASSPRLTGRMPGRPGGGLAAVMWLRGHFSRQRGHRRRAVADLRVSSAA